MSERSEGMDVALDPLVGRLRHAAYHTGIGTRARNGLLIEAADEIERLRAALKGYYKNPDECAGPDGACVSHMAYEELTAQLRAAGWTWDEPSERWLPPNADSASKNGAT